MNDDAIKEYETNTINPKLAGRPGSAIALPRDKGFVYVRTPTPDEHVMMQSQSDAPTDAFLPVYNRYVEACIIGCVDGEGVEFPISQIKDRGGPAFISGPIAEAVNRLAGNRKVVARDL